MEIDKIKIENDNELIATIQKGNEKFKMKGEIAEINLTYNQGDMSEIRMHFYELNAQVIEKSMSLPELKEALGYKVKLKTHITDELIDTLEDFGISVYTTNGNVKPAKDIIVEIMEIYPGLIDNEKDRIKRLLHESDVL